MGYRLDLGDRDKVWAAAKLAVRRYSRDPSETTEADVRRNMRQLRELPAAESATFWTVRTRRRARRPDALS